MVGGSWASGFGSGLIESPTPDPRSPYLGLGHNVFCPEGGTEEGGQRGGNDDWIR